MLDLLIPFLNRAFVSWWMAGLWGSFLDYWVLAVSVHPLHFWICEAYIHVWKCKSRFIFVMCCYRKIANKHNGLRHPFKILFISQHFLWWWWKVIHFFTLFKVVERLLNTLDRIDYNHLLKLIRQKILMKNHNLWLWRCISNCWHWSASKNLK